MTTKTSVPAWMGALEIDLTGFDLLNTPMLNKGTAFTDEERDQFRLHGLVPPHVGSLDEQVERRLKALRAFETDFERYSSDAAASVVGEIERAGGKAKAKAVQADAADAAAIKAAIETAVATYGGLDILVNNAGTAVFAPFEEATAADVDRMIDINLRGVMFATQPR